MKTGNVEYSTFTGWTDPRTTFSPPSMATSRAMSP